MYSIIAAFSSQAIAGVGVGHGKRETAATGGDQDHIQHQDSPELFNRGRAIS